MLWQQEHPEWVKHSKINIQLNIIITIILCSYNIEGEPFQLEQLNDMAAHLSTMPCTSPDDSDLCPVSVGCFNEENYVNSKVEGKPDDPGEVISEVMQPHPVWESFDPPPPPPRLLVWLKPVCSTTYIEQAVNMMKGWINGNIVTI